MSTSVGNIEIRATVFSAAAFLDFRVDGAGNDVARGKFHALGIVLFHEALACLVAQDAAFSANCFGDENALHTGRPDHSGGMELNEFHVHELGAGFIGKGHAVAGVFPGVGSNAPGFANAAGSDDDRFCPENDEAAVLAPVRKRTGNAAVSRQKPSDGAFHVDVNTLLNATVLQRSNHFEAGAVADVAEAFEGVAAEGALQDLAGFSAVEESAPLFEFTNAIRRFLGMQLSHAPVIQKFSAAHGVAKMSFPTVGGIHVGHCRGDASFGHDGVSFPQKRFADHADGSALRKGFDGGTQSSAAGSDDKNVVLARLVGGSHKILRSRIAPQATMRT